MKPMVFAAVLLVALIGQLVAETLTENAEVDSPLHNIVKRAGGGGYSGYYRKVPKYGGYRKIVRNYRNYGRRYYYNGKRNYKPRTYGYYGAKYRYSYKRYANKAYSGGK